jgi:phosphopantetheinyl transferase
VDAEPLDREMEPSALKIADRYFHANELKELSSYPEDSGILKLRFLELWVRKEAFGKLTRKGLKDSIHVDVDALNEASFIQAPKTPAGYLAVIAVGA